MTLTLQDGGTNEDGALTVCENSDWDFDADAYIHGHG